MVFGVIPLLLLGVAAIVATLWYAHVRTQERRRSLSALASRLGFTFDPRRDPSHDRRFAHFEIFRRGHSRAAMNTMSGSARINGAEHPVVMGDFTYKITTHSGKSTSTHTYHLSYLIISLPRPGVPDLLIRPEGFFDKIGQALGFDDIDFEDAEFSRKFVVKSSDRRFAYDVCHPRMIEWLKENAPNFPALDLEAGRLCLARDKRRWTPAEFELALGYARQFIDRWPDHLLLELGLATREGLAKP